MFSEDQINLLTRLFQEHSGFVAGVARRYCSAADQVDDIVQQTYLDFLSRALEKKWDLNRNPKALLYKIAKDHAMLFWRRQAVQNRALAQLTERLLLDAPDDEHDKRFEAEMLAMRSCIEKLSPKAGALVRRHYFEGVSMKDIAEEQESKSGTIRYVFHRIRLNLRTCVENAMEHLR